MKPIRNYIMGTVLFPVLTAPFTLLVGTLGVYVHKAYNSGFIRTYNDAVMRNSNTRSEEFGFKRRLLNDIHEFANNDLS